MNHIPVTINGHTYKSIHAACKALELKPGRIYQMVQNGASPEVAIKQAINTPTQTYRKIIIEDTTYASIEDACKAYGYKSARVLEAARKHGISTEDQLKSWIANNQRPQHKPLWTKDEIDIVQKYYPIFGASIPAAKLGRTRANITNTARRFGYKTDHRNNCDGQNKDYVLRLAYKTDDNDFYYWFYHRPNNVIMLLSADEIINYLQHPSVQFCQRHALPAFIHVPFDFIKRISNAQQWSYQTWLTHQ